MRNSSTINSLEYYSSCPSCGAVNTGKKFCEYCGASMVKKATQMVNEPSMTIENSFLMEDVNLPLVKGKNCGKNLFMVLFCSIFGGMFFMVPTIICITFIATGIMQPWIIGMLSLFWVIGIGALTPMILSIKNRSKCKNGKHITGIVRGYEDSMVMVNNRPVQNMRIRIDDENPRIVLLSTGVSYCRYPVGGTVRLINYENYYMFED